MSGNNSTNSTTNSTANSNTTITNTTESPYVFQRCYDELLSDSQSNIAKYLMYFCGAWIIIWCLITILVNLCHKNKGHQRYVHMFEELSIILLAICMCILNFVFDHKTKVCKFIAIANHFFMCLTASIFFAEAWFASSMVHAKSNKNGSLPAILYYLFPIVAAVGPTLATYFTEKEYYGTAYIHCFAVTTVDMMWGFVIPVWIILTLAGLKAQLACIACDKHLPSQDIAQCYWARRSVKSLVMISQYLFSVWLMVMFSAEHQKLYLFIVTTCMVVPFGPALFVCHTFGHLNTCKKWAGSGCFGNLYTMCPPKPEPPEKDEFKDDDDEDKPDEPEEKKPSDEGKEKPKETDPENRGNPENINSSNPAHRSGKVSPTGPTRHAESQKFYSWLTNEGGNGRSGDILFKPHIA